MEKNKAKALSRGTPELIRDNVRTTDREDNFDRLETFEMIFAKSHSFSFTNPKQFKESAEVHDEYQLPRQST